jgi:hypothetical protein
MRIRSLSVTDRPGVVAVYNARSRVSTGLMRRGPRHWARVWPRRTTKDVWLVAVDRARIAGYAVAAFDGGSGGYSLETLWLPEYDAAGLCERLVGSLLSRIQRRDPLAISAWVTAGSPALPIYERLIGHPRPPASVFMAGVVDVRALIVDTVRVIERRTPARLRLRVGGRAIVTPGRGRVQATVSFDADALLGILLGIRRIGAELVHGRVTVAPQNRENLELVKRAFPPRGFFIQDAW